MDDLALSAELDTPGAPALLVIWTAAMFLSILVHEMGHALAMRYYGLGGRIVLYHFGGLAIPDGMGAWNAARRRPISPLQQIAISAAGPGMQLALAMVAWSVAVAVQVPTMPTFWIEQWFGLEFGDSRPLGSILGYASFDAILYPSIWWAILNLAPILPLDGGQIARDVFSLARVADPIRAAHVISIVVAGLIGFYFLRGGEPFGIMFLLFAVSNWQAMQGPSMRY